MSVGIVVVSHSRALADAAVALAGEMTSDDRRPPIAVAAGVDGGFGTDAAAIAEAITTVDSPAGTLVLLDLGSALLSAEMALEFVDPDVAERTRLSPAPFVEGLLAAVVAAAGGAALERVAAEAAAGAAAKVEQLGDAAPEPAPEAAPSVAEGLQARFTLRNPHGLHARPAARLAACVAEFDARVEATDSTRATGPVDAGSATALAALAARCGDEIRLSAAGPQAVAALAAIVALADEQFGEHPVAAAADGRERPRIGPARAVRLPGEPGRPDRALDSAAYDAAQEAAVEALDQLATALPGEAPAELREILVAQRALLADRGTARAVRRRLDSGADAWAAVDAEYRSAERRLAALDDPYLAQRAQDVRALRRAIQRALAGEPSIPAPPTTPHVLVGDELDALTAVQLRPGTTQAVAVAEPSTDGHGAQIAAALGIPFLADQASAVSVPDGTPVCVDPEHGLCDAQGVSLADAPGAG